MRNAQAIADELQGTMGVWRDNSISCNKVAWMVYQNSGETSCRTAHNTRFTYTQSYVVQWLESFLLTLQAFVFCPATRHHVVLCLVWLGPCHVAYSLLELMHYYQLLNIVEFNIEADYDGKRYMPLWFKIVLCLVIQQVTCQNIYIYIYSKQRCHVIIILLLYRMISPHAYRSKLLDSLPLVKSTFNGPVNQLLNLQLPLMNCTYAQWKNIGNTNNRQNFQLVLGYPGQRCLLLGWVLVTWIIILYLQK